MNPVNLLAEKRLISLKGVGEKTEKLFARLGIYDLDELVHYYPRAYDVYSDCVSVGALTSGEKQSLLVRIQTEPIVKRLRHGSVTLLNIKEGAHRLEVIWFNMPYLRSTLKKGSRVVLRGMVVLKDNRLRMEHPEIIGEEAYEVLKGRIQPIYSLTAGLTSKVVAKAVRQIFEKYSFYDYLPEDIKERYSLVARDFALNRIHFPEDSNSLGAAKKRIVFDEFMFYLLRLSLLNEGSGRGKNRFIADDTELTDKVISNLSYELTSAQNTAWEEIRADMASDGTMNRLLQGDVGSGKTIVAFLAVLSMMSKGFQSALMAPTEVLAEQHYHSFISILNQNNIDTKRIVLLTGSLCASEKRGVQSKIKSGEALVVIGTHAIIQEKVRFANLGLAVTDEQHRFGVAQRKLISEKGKSPHVLIMSATPIPRTLAIIMYAGLDISVLNEMPKKRLRVKNCVVDASYRKTAYSFMVKEIRSGRQAYIICPMIEDNEDLPFENVTGYTAKMKSIFPKDINIAMLHGRMSSQEKLAVMKEFSENKIQLLISTTVIEVGIDVPNATVMLIENAERFGLAQLHQLRGRIGRGDRQSYCIFMKGNSSDEIDTRLDIVNKSNDGFYIANEDLKSRGQGDLFGLRQSGEAGFAFADPFADADILKEASDAVKEILQEDPNLTSEKYSLLASTLEQLNSRLESVL